LHSPGRGAYCHVFFFHIYAAEEGGTHSYSISGDRTSSLNVAPENFSRQMAYLDSKGYKVISLGELVDNIKEGKTFLPRTVVVTFDDGFEDNYLNAFPVLARHKMPAIIFLITSYVGDREGYMNWDQVRLMMANGIDFGGHTRNNVYLPSVKDERQLRDETVGCREDIKRKTGKEALYFCYPTGGYNEKVKKAVTEAGYKGACTTNRGSDRRNRDVFELNRVKVTNSDMTKPMHFRAKISGYYNVFRRLKSGD